MQEKQKNVTIGRKFLCVTNTTKDLQEFTDYTGELFTPDTSYRT